MLPKQENESLFNVRCGATGMLPTQFISVFQPSVLHPQETLIINIYREKIRSKILSLSNCSASKSYEGFQDDIQTLFKDADRETTPSKKIQIYAKSILPNFCLTWLKWLIWFFRTNRYFWCVHFVHLAFSDLKSPLDRLLSC